MQSSPSQPPLKISWFFDHRDHSSLKHRQVAFPTQIEKWPVETYSDAKGQIFEFKNPGMGKMGLCQCPGKKMELGRDGKKHDREVGKDVEYFANKGVKVILCLLSDFEIRSIGCKVADYEQACLNFEIKLIKFPIIEMAPPEDLEAFNQFAVQEVVQALLLGQNVIVHCRGGVGRAGLMACCVLSYFFHFKSYKHVIELLRARRDKRSVESRNQEDFVKKFYTYVNHQFEKSEPHQRVEEEEKKSFVSKLKQPS